MHGLDPLPGGIRRRRSIIDLAGGLRGPDSSGLPRPCGGPLTRPAFL